MSGRRRGWVAVVLACAAAGTVVGCSAPSPAPYGTPSRVDRTTLQSVAPGALGEFSSTCTDAVGDGSRRVDIESVELLNDGTLTFVTFRLSEPVQPTDFDQVSFLVMAYSADGEQGYQFGSLFIDGRETASFVADLDVGFQKNFDNGVVFADGMAAMRYPVVELVDLGSEFTWYAAVSVDSFDADLCAGPLDDAISVMGGDERA